jgi:hypothetical protein
MKKLQLLITAAALAQAASALATPDVTLRVRPDRDYVSKAGPREVVVPERLKNLIGITKSIARGFAAEGVYAFAVTPGFTMTGMAEDYLASRGGDKLLQEIPLGRVAEPEEVANALTYLALTAPASMTGAVIDINGASYVR